MKLSITSSDGSDQAFYAEVGTEEKCGLRHFAGYLNHDSTTTSIGRDEQGQETSKGEIVDPYLQHVNF